MEPYHTGRRIFPNRPEASRLVKQHYRFTDSAKGKISLADAAFLLSLIDAERPSTLLELGVASGSSTVMQLKLFEETNADARLISVDALDRYYEDRTKPVGYLVYETWTQVPPGWTLVAPALACSFQHHPALANMKLDRRLDFAFIDANHRHPWPVLDLLCLLPWLKPGSWVALHDINLPLILGVNHTFGPGHLLAGWGGECIVGEQKPYPNIGAIRLSDASTLDAKQLLSLLEEPWEIALDPYFVKQIKPHLLNTLSPDCGNAITRFL